MSVYTNLQIALETKLNTITGSPSIAWPNTEFKPSHGTLYLEPMLLPILSTLETLNDYQRYEGIYQINVSVPVEKGTATLNLWLDRINDLFISDRRLTAGGDTVFIQAIERGPTQRDSENDIEYYRSNIDIAFIVYT
tara:strand:- start:1121 stop:1531 length:411 start_codon:yes stop_codon:yes gene_type:complete